MRIATFSSLAFLLALPVVDAGPDAEAIEAGTSARGVQVPKLPQQSWPAVTLPPGQRVAEWAPFGLPRFARARGRSEVVALLLAQGADRAAPRPE